VADPPGQPAPVPGGRPGDRPVQRRRRLRPARVRAVRPLEGWGMGRRPLDRGHLRGPPGAVPGRTREARPGHAAHGPARAVARDPRGRPRDRRDGPRTDGDGRDRRRYPPRRLRDRRAPDRDPARDAPYRAARAPPAQGEARARSPADRLHLRTGRAGQGPGVRDRGDARGRRAAPGCALPDRRADAPGAAEATSRRPWSRSWISPNTCCS
jgi:hypothetical protein